MTYAEIIEFKSGLRETYYRLQQLHKLKLCSTFSNNCMEFVLKQLQVAARDCKV